MVLGTCRRVLGHRQDAEDAFQAAFLVLARRAGVIVWRESAGPWLYATAYRVALRLRRRRLARDRAERAAVPPPVSRPSSAVSSAAWRELCAVLDHELARLPSRFRAPLVMCYLEGKTVDQAAAELRVPRGTVASRLARARQLLRRRLARRGIGDDGPAVVAMPAVLADVPVPAPLSAAAVRASLPVAAAAARRPGVFDASMKGWDLLMRLIALAPRPLAAAVVGFVAVVTSLTVLVPAADPPEVRAAKDAWAATAAAEVSDKLWLDKTHGWALRRREVRDAGGALLLRCVNSAFKEVSPQFWIPLESAEDYFPPPQATPEQRARPAFTIRMKVSKVAVNTLDEAFFNGAGK
jgi:RNA polymerase sigma factor (sigma-70 family)